MWLKLFILFFVINVGLSQLLSPGGEVIIGKINKKRKLNKGGERERRVCVRER